MAIIFLVCSGLLSSRSFQGGETPLTIIGPKGIKEFVETSLRISDSRLKYDLIFNEIDQTGIIFKDHQFEVTCLPLDHRITSYGFRIQEAITRANCWLKNYKKKALHRALYMGS